MRPGPQHCAALPGVTAVQGEGRLAALLCGEHGSSNSLIIPLSQNLEK